MVGREAGAAGLGIAAARRVGVAAGQSPRFSHASATPPARLGRSRQPDPRSARSCCQLIGIALAPAPRVAGDEQALRERQAPHARPRSGCRSRARPTRTKRAISSRRSARAAEPAAVSRYGPPPVLGGQRRDQAGLLEAGQDRVQRPRTHPQPAERLDVGHDRVAVLVALGQAGEHEHGGLGIAAELHARVPRPACSRPPISVSDISDTDIRRRPARVKGQASRSVRDIRDRVRCARGPAAHRRDPVEPGSGIGPDRGKPEERALPGVGGTSRRRADPPRRTDR